MIISLPDGTKISARPGAQSGRPTIEVTDRDGKTVKNRFPELKDGEKDDSETEEKSRESANSGEGSNGGDGVNSNDKR